MINPTALRAARTDISDNDRYRLLVEAITDYAIYMLDQDGYVSSWNPGARRFKGYEAAEIIGQHFSKFYTEEDRNAGKPARALAIAAQEGRFENEGWRVRKDGTIFWVHVVIDPIRDPSGELLGFAKITRDLTERKMAQDTLANSEQQFRILVEGVSDYAIYMLDREGRVSNWNTGAQRIKGYKPEEIVGSHFSRFYTPEDVASGEPAKGLAIAAREGRFEKEGWRLRKDGTRFWAHVVIDAIHTPDGELLGFAKITRDITERRDTQIALERAREALFQSQKMEAIGQLTGGVAHDFNNLLMAVLGSLELLRKRIPADDRTALLLNNAFEGAKRGVALTQRMLAFARRQDLTLTAVNLWSLVEGMNSLLERSVGPAIVIENLIPHALPAVQADANQLENALLNLAVNARDAMPAGGTLTLAARMVEIADGAASKLIPGAYICLALTDTGEGMDQATLTRAAEPFFTTKGVGKGTGLGLSMIHGMAEQIGGQLTLASALGKGTTAELWLPAAIGTTAAGVTAAAIASTAPGRALSILVVDDDRLVLVNTAAMLEELGHLVFEASSGKQALEIFHGGQKVDMVITDHAMPQMTGSQLADTIRAEQPALPILLVSGYAELPAGAGQRLPRLTKPFSLEDLAAAVQRLTQETLPLVGPQPM
jgi:PAS domain S-box-containing protein